MSFPTTTVSTTDIDQGTDSPKSARLALYDALQKLNAIITALGQALGICPLNAASKVDSTYLTASVDHAAIQPEAVEADNIKPGEINFLHLNATITADPTPPTGGVDGDLYFIYD